MFCKYLLISLIASTLLLSVSSATVAKEKKERPKKLSASINPERLKALKQSLEIKLFLKMTFPDACPVGIVEPIWEGDAITETYCRCPGGSYGFTCQENFVNPCSQYGGQYSSADSRVPSNYFIECNGPIPYLIKCAKGTVWNQRITVCDWDRSSLSVRKGPYQQKDNVLSYDEDYSHVLKPVHLDNPYSIQTIIQTDTYKQAAAQKDIYKSEFDNVIKQTLSNSNYGQQTAPVIQAPQPQQVQQRPVSNNYDSSKNYQSQPVATANPNDYRFDLLLINQQNQPDLSQSPYQSNIVAEAPKPIQTQPILPQQAQPQQQSNYYNQQPTIVQTIPQQNNQQYTQQAPVVQNLPQQNHQFDMPDFYHQQTVNQQQPAQYQQQTVQLPADMNNIQQQTGAPIVDNSNSYQQAVQQPIVQQPIVQQPIVQQPIVQQPIVQQPIVQQPIVQQPIVQQPIVQQPVDNSYSYNQQQLQNQPMPTILPETQPQIPQVQSQPIQNAPAAYGQQSVPMQQVPSPSYNQQAPPVQQQAIDQTQPQQQSYYGQGPVVDPSQQQPQVQATLPEQPQQIQSNMIEQSFGNSQRITTGQFQDDSSAGPMSGQVRSILETIQKPIIAATMSAIYDQIQRPNGGLRTSQSISGQPQQMILDTMLRPPQSSPLIILQQPNNAKNGIANVATSGPGPITTGGIQQGPMVGVVAPSRPGQLVSSPAGANTGFGGPGSISNPNGVLGSGAGAFNPTVSSVPSIPSPSTQVQQLPTRQLQQQHQPGLGRSVSLLRMLLPQVTPTTINGDQQLVNVKIPFDKTEMSPDCANNLPNGLNLAMSVSFF